MRDELIKKIEALSKEAESMNELFPSAILDILQASMIEEDEEAFAEHCVKYGRQRLADMEAKKEES